MRNIFLILLLIGVSSSSSAMSCDAAGTYCSNVVITKIMITDNGKVLIGTHEPIPGTCNYFGYSIWINMGNGTDANNPMFSSFLTFLSQKKKIHIQLTPSAVSGTDHTNGCTSTSLSLIRNVRATFNPDDYGPDELIPPGDELIK